MNESRRRFLSLTAAGVSMPVMGWMSPPDESGLEQYLDYTLSDSGTVVYLNADSLTITLLAGEQYQIDGSEDLHSIRITGSHNEAYEWEFEVEEAIDSVEDITLLYTVQTTPDEEYVGLTSLPSFPDAVSDISTHGSLPDSSVFPAVLGDGVFTKIQHTSGTVRYWNRDAESTESIVVKSLPVESEYAYEIFGYGIVDGESAYYHSLITVVLRNESSIQDVFEKWVSIVE